MPGRAPAPCAAYSRCRQALEPVGQGQQRQVPAVLRSSSPLSVRSGVATSSPWRMTRVVLPSLYRLVAATPSGPLRYSRVITPCWLHWKGPIRTAAGCAGRVCRRPPRRSGRAGGRCGLPSWPRSWAWIAAGAGARSRTSRALARAVCPASGVELQRICRQVTALGGPV